jgi:hypothetical protein
MSSSIDLADGLEYLAQLIFRDDYTVYLIAEWISLYIILPLRKVQNIVDN